MAKRYWFTAKKFGWGWTPSSIEGWAVMALYLIALLGLIFIYRGQFEDPPIDFYINLGLITALLIYIAWRNAEPQGIKRIKINL